MGLRHLTGGLSAGNASTVVLLTLYTDIGSNQYRMPVADILFNHFSAAR
jgi:hypothetical protein